MISEAEDTQKVSTWRVVWVQTFTGGKEVLHSGVATHAEAVRLMQEAKKRGVGFGGAVYVEEEE